LSDAPGPQQQAPQGAAGRQPSLQREDALAAELARYRALVDASPVLLWQANAQGRVVFRSENFARYTGLPIGLPMRAALELDNATESPAWTRAAIVHPDDLPQVLLQWSACVASGQSFEMELRLRGADGLYRWHLNRGQPLSDAQGQVSGWAGSCVNIDDMKLMEAAVRESEERFRAMADSAPLMIWVTDPQGQILFVNRAFFDFFGKKQRDIANSSWADLLHPDDLARHQAAYAEALRTRQPFHAQVRVRHADGLWRWVDSAGAPRFTGNGDFAGLVGTSPDITELKRAGEALSEADRHKTEFLAMLAHELRNPLVPIRSAVLLMRRLGSPDDQLNALRDVVERQTNHLARLIDDLLDLARINEGKIVLRESRAALAALVAQAVETVQPLMEAAGHQLSVALPADPVHLFADETRLTQVLSNLLSNAVKYCQPGGHVALSAQADAGWLRLSVKDDGVGISTDMLTRVFELFTQDERSLDRARGGLGIGLTLVKRVVEMHGGSVQAFSDGPGCGSEFVLRLPLAASPLSADLPMPENAAMSTSDLSPDAAASAGRKRRVLVVDDNIDALQTTTLLLELEGLEVQTAADGAQAISTARQFQPDVVMLDIGLPGMNGFEVARKLRAEFGDASMLMIAVTGYGQPEDIRKSKDAGFDHHLIKPVVHERLMALISSTPA
jgi:PAS domain S-box-containing protein